MRVDRVGETAAAIIYDGQLAALKNTPIGITIYHIKKQEQDYLNKFSQLLLENDTRYAASLPLWNIMEFSLGAAGAMISEKEAKAFTISVEMIKKHYTK